MRRYMYVHRSLFETLSPNNGIFKIIKQQKYHDKLLFFLSFFFSVYTLSVGMQGYNGLLYTEKCPFPTYEKGCQK